jgi:hypothetical protein
VPEAALVYRFNLGKGLQLPSIGSPFDGLILRWTSSEVSFLKLSSPESSAEDLEDDDQVSLPLSEENDPF